MYRSSLVLVFTAWLTPATAFQAVVAQDDNQALEEAISRALETSPSGTRLAWAGPQGNSGIVAPGPAHSRATGGICDHCADPCRRIIYSITTPEVTSEYKGVRCRQASIDGTDAPWVPTKPDERVRYSPVKEWSF